MIHSIQPPAAIDPRGPIRSIVEGKAMTASVAAGQVSVRGFTFNPTAIPARPGHAGWVWLPTIGLSEAKPVAALFRKEIDLSEAPRSAEAWFSADAHARIYVNGRLAARGPDDGGQDYPGQQTGKWFVNYRDLTPFFRKGKNAIAVEVFNADAMEGRYNTSGHGGLLFETELHMPGGSVTSLCADDTWRGVPSAEWKFAEWNPSKSAQGSTALQFDASAEALAWRTAGFDDSSWPRCTAAPDRWPNLTASEIPPRFEAVYPAQQIVRPVGKVVLKGQEITFDGDGSCAVRFDRVLSAFIGVKLRGSAGTILAIQPNEPNSAGYHRMATVLLRDGEQIVELPFYDSFSVINLVATNVHAPLQVLDVRANFVAQPVTYRGSFSCSDEKLDRIWDSCRWLTQICQQTHHLDSPHHQEPICDPGDYLVISLDNYCAFGQPSLARQDLRKYAWLLEATHFRPFHTSYALLWLQMLMEYERYTGDTALVAELSPTVHKLLDQFATYRGKNGLISEAPDYMFMDWVNIAGFGAHHPPAVIGQGYMTAFYYRALADGIHVAQLSSDTARIAKYDRLRGEIFEAYNRELWDERAGLYRDGKPFVTSAKPGDWLPADTDIETHSTHNNTLAVLYDLAPIERQTPIMRRLMSGDLNTQPYFMVFVFAALDHAGLFNDFGTPQIRRWTIQPETQSFREMWDTGDYSHAWQCTPLFQMSSRILGITPLTPGFRHIRIRPLVCDLAWARGEVPTPHGNVEVHWKRSPEMFGLGVHVPKGCEADLEVPLVGVGPNVTLDGRKVLTFGDQKVIALPVRAGNHNVLVEYPTAGESAKSDGASSEHR
jgi:hypothetical protein